MDLKVGQRVGDYEIISILGAGGMGQVYKVRNVISNRIEAMKVLLDSLVADPDLTERFLREIRVLAEMDHPHIAGLHTAHQIDGRILMIMEYVEGTSLFHVLQRGPLAKEDAVRCIAQVLEGLQYAHSRGVVHRDVKPSNILIDSKGNAKLTDFGIARGANTQLTQTGATVGSIHYMSPEQIRAEELDGRSDLYAVGITLYEMVTGRKPFDAQSHFSIMSGHLNEVPRPPVEVDPRVPASLNALILTSIEKDRAKRFQSAEAMRRALLSSIGAAPEAAAPQPKPAQPQPQPQRQPPVPQPPVTPAKRPDRRALYVLAGALAMVAVLVVAAVELPWFRRTSAQTSPPAIATQPTVEAPPQPTAGPQSPTASLPQNPTTSPINHQQPKAAANPQPAAMPATSQPSNTPVSQPPAQPQPLPVAQVDPPPAQPQPQQPAVPPADTANRAELSRLRERLVQLAIRAGAVRQTLSNLKQQQARMGLGVRSDFTSAEQRLSFSMDEAEAAIKSGDSAAANRQLESAERSLSFLEDKLGR